MFNGLLSCKYKIILAGGIPYLADVFIVNFYSYPLYGVTEIGKLAVAAKYNRDRRAIGRLTEIIKRTTGKILTNHSIDAYTFIPPNSKENGGWLGRMAKD